MFLREKIFAGEGKIKSDTVLKNCRIVNVSTKEITKGDIAINSGFIAGIGDVVELMGGRTEVLDIKNAYVCPGLLDGHVHFESSMVTLTQFAKQSLLHGTTGIVIDPHEIANILGARGIRLIMREAKRLPIDVFVAISSCVPSSPLETSGARLDLYETKKFLDEKYVVGLGEVMDYPEVLRGSPEKLGKIAAALERKLEVDGHCPGMRGRDLFGYMCAGISSDHESVTYDEALEKARLGMKIMLREGSAAKSLDDFIPELLSNRISLENFFFVSDDKHPGDLIEGYMDAVVRKAIQIGIEPIAAISMATLNTARHYRIDQLVGSVSIGRRANLIILDDLQAFRIKDVITCGKINPKIEVTKYPGYAFRTVKYKKIEPNDLTIKSKKRTISARVIEIVPGQLITKKGIEILKTKEQALLPDINRDILAIAVIERHGKSGNIGRGFVRGFGMEEGAIGQSIAHDSHNVILVGTNFEDMALCANKIRELQGGIVIAKDRVINFLHLPFAGILSTESASEVDEKLKELHSMLKKMGCKLDAPFIQMSFLSLPVIPSLKITDKGLVDVEAFKIIPVLTGNPRHLNSTDFQDQ
ncbi:MAG: adenine deaminase [Candidatus Methanoperedens sp.]|nr:adenine deaminase [Candidatus Methanoperedens sp.]MCZ7395991.1 adenine deaminase [Candidatus Methanoperedens sp.]